MAHGRVKWFNNAKGFGFIEQDGVEKDIFVHHTSIKADGYRSLSKGEEVAFDLIDSPKGPKAENVVQLTMAH